MRPDAATCRRKATARYPLISDRQIGILVASIAAVDEAVIANAERRHTEAVGRAGGDGVNQIDSAVAVEDHRLSGAGVDRSDEDLPFRPSVSGEPGSDHGTPTVLSRSI